MKTKQTTRAAASRRNGHQVGVVDQHGGILAVLEQDMTLDEAEHRIGQLDVLILAPGVTATKAKPARK